MHKLDLPAAWFCASAAYGVLRIEPRGKPKHRLPDENRPLAARLVSVPFTVAERDAARLTYRLWRQMGPKDRQRVLDACTPDHGT